MAVVTRRRWISDITAWLTSPEGRAALARHHMREQRFLAVAVAMAQHGHRSTGRNIAITNHRLADETGYSESTITVVRRILLTAGWLFRGAQGCSSRSGRRNRPAVVHLTTPRPIAPSINESSCVTYSSNSRPVDNQVGGIGARGRVYDPLRTTQVTTRTPVNHMDKKPKARRGALRDSARTQSAEVKARWRQAYRLAEELEGRASVFRFGRGSLAATLMFSPLHLQQWSGRTLQAALDVCAQQRRWDWPADLRTPGAFLGWRLKQIEVEPACTSLPAQYVSQGPVQAAGEGRRAAMAAVRAHTGWLARTRHDRGRSEPVGAGRGFTFVALDGR